MQCFRTDSFPGPAETWVVPLDKARMRTAETAQKKLGEIDEMNYCILGLFFGILILVGDLEHEWILNGLF